MSATSWESLVVNKEVFDFEEGCCWDRGRRRKVVLVTVVVYRVGGRVKGGGARKDDAQLAGTEDGLGEGEVDLSVEDGSWSISPGLPVFCCQGDRESFWG